MRNNIVTASKRKPKSKIRWGAIVLVLLIAAGAGAGWYFYKGPGSVATAKSSGPDYHTTTVRRSSITISASGSGSLIANSSVDLSFSTRGSVAELKVNLGDKVTAGQLLARLGNSETLQAAEASAELQLLQSQKTLNDLQQNAGVALAQSYQALLKAQSAATTAQYNVERAGYARCSQDTNTRLASILDNATKTLSDLGISNSGTERWIQAKANVETAQANYTYCLSYTAAEKSSLQASLDVAKINLDQADKTYNTLKTASGVDPSALALAEANLKQADTQLAKTKSDLQGIELVAPMDGVVTYVKAQQGAIVDTSKFISISDLSKPTLTVSIDQADLAKLVIGSRAEAVFDALPSQTFQGKIVSVDPQMTSSGQYMVAKGTLELDAEAAKAVQSLPLGISATITIIDKQASNALIVPLAALRDLGGKNYAVFLVKNGKLALTPVKVGLMDSAQAEITSGIQEGDVVSTGIVQGTGN
jgi:RND family efflux transporter MFP subunit